MALHKKSELAAKLGVKLSNISNWLARGNMVETDAGLIDDTNPINKEWLMKKAREQATKKGKSVASSTGAAVSESNVPGASGAGDFLPESNNEGVFGSAIQYNIDGDEDWYNQDPTKWKNIDEKQQIIKLKTAMLDERKARLQLQKLEGLLVPVDQMKIAISHFSRATAGAYDAAVNNFLDQMQRRYNMSYEDIAENRTVILATVNKAIDDATTAATKRIMALSDEMRDSRGRGEK